MRTSDLGAEERALECAGTCVGAGRWTEIHTALEAIDEQARFEESNSSTVGEEAVEKPNATAHRGSPSSVEGEAEGVGSYSDIVRLHVCAGHECPVGGA